MERLHSSRTTASKSGVCVCGSSVLREDKEPWSGRYIAYAAMSRTTKRYRDMWGVVAYISFATKPQHLYISI